MTDEIGNWVKERFVGDSRRFDVVSWGRENGWHDHEAIEFHPDGDIDYYIGTHPNKR
jgi:hypothetical protein